MKKIFSLILLTGWLFAGSISVDIPCEQLREYETKCAAQQETNTSTEYTYKGSITWGTDWQNENAGKPYVGEVKIIYTDAEVPEIISKTNTEGKFIIPVLPDRAFKIYAFSGKEWMTYKTKIILKITATGKESWLEFNTETRRWNKHDPQIDVKGSSPGNLIETSQFKPGENAVDFKSISKTSFSTLATKGAFRQGASITIETKPNTTYQMTVEISAPVNIHFSNIKSDWTYERLRPSAMLISTSIDQSITLDSFKTIGTKSYFYFAPIESGEFKLKNIFLKEISDE